VSLKIEKKSGIKEVESYDLSKFEFAIMDNNAYTY
jgi:hypothetical protein